MGIFSRLRRRERTRRLRCAGCDGLMGKNQLRFFSQEDLQASGKFDISVIGNKKGLWLCKFCQKDLL
jgi:hypothetical protein